MKGVYHAAITRAAAGDLLPPAELELVIQANLDQDRVGGMVGHPEFHGDDSRFADWQAYIDAQRDAVVRGLASAAGRPSALAALGRLLHALQDFYAHSNWVSMWVAGQGGLEHCSPAGIPPCQDPLAVAQLRSGRADPLTHVLYGLPCVGPWLDRRHAFPASHAAMNLDHPGRGPLFDFAVSAATKHSRMELEALLR